MEVTMVKELIKSGKSYEEISEILRNDNPNTRGLSRRSVRRFCHNNEINKKASLGKDRLDEMVRDEVLKVGILLSVYLYIIATKFRSSKQY